MIGFAFCGSFCTHEKALGALTELVRSGEDVLPILSERAASTDTRFGKAEELIRSVASICGRLPVLTISDAEPLGPKILLEALIVAPCTGNTLAKMANGITDSVVTMAVKAHRRQDRPLLLALASNDALSSNLGAIGAMALRKDVYFVPMIQDSPETKPHSLVADFDRISESLGALREHRQIVPLFR